MVTVVGVAAYWTDDAGVTVGGGAVRSRSSNLFTHYSVPALNGSTLSASFKSSRDELNSPK